MSEPSALTSLLVFAFAVVFVVGLFIARQADAGFDYLAKGHTPTLTTIGAVSGQYLADGQWWRLIASGFVHIGIIHLLLNLYALLSLGRIADALWGRWRFLLIFMFSVVGGSLVTMAWRPNVLLAGASGGIWGVMMSLVAGLVIFREHLPIEFLRAESRNFFLAFGLNLMVSFVPGIAWDAHLAGGAVGFVVAILLDRIRAGAGNEGWIALVVIVLLAAIAVTGFRWQMRNSETWKPIRTWQEMMTAVRSAPPATETTPKTQTQVNLRVDPEVVFKIVAKLQNDGLMAAVAGSRNRMSRVVKAAADAHLESKQLAGLIRQNVKQPDLVHFFDTVVVVIQQIDDLAKANAGPKEWQALDEPIAELKGKMESLRMAAPALPP